MEPMTILKFVILLILGTATGTGIGFLAAKVLLKRLIGEYKPSFSQKLAQAINERLTSVDRELAAEFTEKSAARIRAWVQTWYRQHSSNTMPLREALERAVSAEAVDQIAEGARKQLTEMRARQDRLYKPRRYAAWPVRIFPTPHFRTQAAAKAGGNLT